jgi:membrane protein involved in colicin uptake
MKTVKSMRLMNVMRKLVVGVTLAILLSGCQDKQINQQDSQANLCQPSTSPLNESCKWTNEMQQTLNHQFLDAAHYAGQQCLVRLEWQNSGRYAVTQMQGDERLCLRAWQVIGQSKGLPPPPVRTQPAWFGFAPSQVSSPDHPAATGAG